MLTEYSSLTINENDHIINDYLIYMVYFHISFEVAK